MGRGVPSNDRALYGITEQAKDLPDLINQHVNGGRRSAAAAMITRRLSDVAPKMPLSFPTVLKKVDQDTALWIAHSLSNDESPVLTIKKTSEGKYEIRAAKGRKRLGQLSTRDTEMLKGFGKDAKLYSPRLLMIHQGDDSSFDHVSIDMVRPEIRICSSCSERHTGESINCEKCRAGRKRIGEEKLEPSPIELHESLDALAELQDGEELISSAA